MTGLAAWASPALFAVIAARAFTGDANAPLLALAALVAPLFALLHPPTDGSAGGVPAHAVVIAASGVVLAANLSVAGDVAAALGAGRGRGLALGIAVAVVGALAPLPPRRMVRLTLAATVLAAVPFVAIALTLALPPWGAWAETGSRPAFRFAAGSVWVTEGRPMAEATTLTFREPHRVTAAGRGTWRVLEDDGAQQAMREWRLSPGEGLALRPGDRLTVEAGGRVRFETGKRVPGAPTSGIAWADPPERRDFDAVADFVGGTLTLLGGALVLLAPRGRGRRGGAAPLACLLGAFVLVAAWSGVYAVHVGADAGLGTASRVPFLRAPAVALGAPWGAAATVLLALAMLGLLAMTAAALRARVVEAASLAREQLHGFDHVAPSTVWLGVVGMAAVLALVPADPWTALLAGLGLAACAWAPAGDERPGLVVAVAAVVFVTLALARPALPPWATVLGAYPLLVAAPLGRLASALATRAADVFDGVAR